MKVRNDRDLATELHCDIRTVQAYRRRGAPMDDISALKEWIAAQRTGPTKGTATEINEAKLEKLRLEIKRLERDNAVADGNVIQKKMVAADARILEAAMESRINVLIGECPAWAGLKPHELQARAKEWGRQTREILHDKTSACYGK